MPLRDRILSCIVNNQYITLLFITLWYKLSLTQEMVNGTFYLLMAGRHCVGIAFNIGNENELMRELKGNPIFYMVQTGLRHRLIAFRIYMNS